LVAKSLLRQEEAKGAARLTMLDTIHEYAQARLVESGELDELRDRHLRFFSALAETAEPELTGPQQERWLQHLAAEHDNLRAALDWGLGQEADRAPQTELGLRLAGALGRFWRMRGAWSEGRRRLDQALQLLDQ